MVRKNRNYKKFLNTFSKIHFLEEFEKDGFFVPKSCENIGTLPHRIEFPRGACRPNYEKLPWLFEERSVFRRAEKNFFK